jgi:antitoxin HicB
MTTNRKHPHEGSSIEDFLHEDGSLEEATITAVKRVIAFQIEESMKKQALTKTAMADRMATSRAQLDRVLDPDNGNVTLETLAKAARAIGRSIKLELA